MFSFNWRKLLKSHLPGESPFAFANQVYVVAATRSAEVKTRHGGFGG
jgi:hypothetical protein